MPYFLFLKKQQHLKFSSAGGALWINPLLALRAAIYFP